MIGFLKKLFKKDTKMNLKSYDIVVEVSSARGGRRRERRNGVQAPNEMFLRNILARNDEKIVEILSVHDGDPIKVVEGNTVVGQSGGNAQVMQLQNNNVPATGTMNADTSSELKEYIQEEGAKAAQPQPKPKDECCTSQAKPAIVVPKVSSKPKYYKIGNIDIKEQDGRIYQKQWMTLSIKDIDDYRVVSDANNKIVPLVGKHIEVRKWVELDDCSCEKPDSPDGKILING